MSDLMRIENATAVEVDQHRWYATIRVHRAGEEPVDIFVCAQGQHSGLWLGPPDEHGDCT